MISSEFFSDFKTGTEIKLVISLVGKEKCISERRSLRAMGLLRL